MTRFTKNSLNFSQFHLVKCVKINDKHQQLKIQMFCFNINQEKCTGVCLYPGDTCSAEGEEARSQAPVGPHAAERTTESVCVLNECGGFGIAWLI